MTAYTNTTHRATHRATHRVLIVLALAASSACSPDSAPLDTSAGVPATPEIGTFGLDRTSVDPGVRPGDDFFAYANGRWHDNFELPPDRAVFGPMQMLEERSTRQVREIIERPAASAGTAGTPQQKISAFYASFMDEAAIEARGLEAARADLDRIAAAAAKSDIAALFGSQGFASTFALSLPPDRKNPDRYCVLIHLARLGLPDREYYLQDAPKLEEIRRQYLAYIQRMLTLLDPRATDAGDRARSVMAFETAVARAQWSIERRRDVEATYNPRTTAQLLAYAPGFDWQAFLDAARLGSRRELVLGELTAIRDIAQIIEQTPLETLKSFLTFRYLSDHARYLPKRFDAARFEFYGRTLRGEIEQRERWKRGVQLVNRNLGELVGQVYVSRHFPPESKAQMQELVANLRAALHERIERLEWMSAPTKRRALEKLTAFTPKIGYPDEWKDYSDLEVRHDDLLGNVRRAQLWRWQYQLARLDKPVDRGEWMLTPQTVNAYYNPSYNEMVFPAAILQPPFFDPGADAAVNYGAIGAVIGHEIGHGFDDQGRKFAADGSLTDWWTPQDSRSFTRRTSRLIAQYSKFEALPGLHLNGAITIGENIGDLGGLSVAYHAYELSLGGREAPVIDGLTGAQRFFLSWAQVWRVKYREGALRQEVLSDVHSPARFRVNGVVRNMDAWYAAFDVKPGDQLYLQPGDRVSIW